MKDTYLIITSIADSNHPVLKQYADEAKQHHVPFIVIGDTKSPNDFNLPGCDFYSVDRQKELNFKLAEILPYKHYARKNLGYLLAISKNAKTIIETDDDNIPFPAFWEQREKEVKSHLLTDMGWVNLYRYFTDVNIWPRGFALENLQDSLPKLSGMSEIISPIQQGLADENPDVDAIYRLILPLPLSFNKADNVSLGNGSICPFNSQNTTWFKEAFPLLYLPSYCSFRMTDIWRSFVAQRIAWTCNWPVLFHNSTVWQERNEHNLMIDFRDEIPGYTNNSLIMSSLQELNLPKGVDNIPDNLVTCYQKLIDLELVGKQEMDLIKAWIKDIDPFI